MNGAQHLTSIVLNTALLLSAGATSQRTDKIDGVPNALLPLARDLHARRAVVDDQERGSRQL